jgi:fatty acid desaturase
MASAALPATKEKSLNDPRLKERLQDLRRTDNVVNWFYLVRTYLFFVVVIGGAVWFDLWRQEAGHSWLWSVPVFAVAIVLVGAGQHQLSALTHEAAHHILFRNRLLNDLVSDLGCMFPLFSSTHHYRLQHLAHHQFVNDPLRDPDVSQLQTSGHWLDFPLGKKAFLLTLLKQLWLPNLLRFIRIRAQYNATGTDKNPYMRKGWKQSKLPIRVGLLYLLTQVALLTWLTWTGQTLLLATLPPALLAAVLVFYAVLPESKFHQSRLHSVISQRVMTLLRVSFLTGVFYALAWVTLLTGVWAAVYYFLLWLVPLLTSFSFFMILRQLVQHGNGGRGWLTNTRVFFVRPFIRFSVFPLGQDFHLPHHLYATVPHYRLPDLHRTLLEYPEYREQAVEVHGYFASPERPQVHPTVLDVVGPAYAPRDPRDVYIDNTVLEDCSQVEEKEEIVREGEAEVRRLADPGTEAPR